MEYFEDSDRLPTEFIDSTLEDDLFGQSYHNTSEDPPLPPPPPPAKAPSPPIPPMDDEEDDGDALGLFGGDSDEDEIAA